MTSGQWQGIRRSEPFLTWHAAKRLAAERNIKSHGFFDGKAANHDAHAARRALLLLRSSDQPPDAIVLLRDEDQDRSRRKGLEQARRRDVREQRIVIGLADPMREGWVIAGFEPQSDEETTKLKSLRRELGFDPRDHAERLTARHESAKKNAKRVLVLLTEGDREREARCWEDADLATLKNRGTNSGLSQYLDEVRQRLVPLIQREPASE